MNWIEIPAGKYRLLPEDKKRSLCQIELNVRYARSVVPWVETKPSPLDGINSSLMHLMGIGQEQHL